MSENGTGRVEVPGAPPIGSTLVSRGRTVTEADVVSFAALTGDWHPQHADAAWAEQGPFGERVAHGMLVLAYAVGLVPFDPERVIALRGLDSVTFKRPVRIGDTIRVRTQVEEVRALDAEHALVAFAWRIVNQEERVAARARVEVLWRTRADDDGEESLTSEAASADASPQLGRPAGAAELDGLEAEQVLL